MIEPIASPINTYLALARTVLQSVRRPLSTREIMNLAYRQGIVPDHLHGRTQHKTLQARLSEDILERGESSFFFRTEPGKFFLREFIEDETLPERFRMPIVARRRERDLPKKNALAFSYDELSFQSADDIQVAPSFVEGRLSENEYHYVASLGERSLDDVLVWAFVVVIKDHLVLSYRQGRYREGRDSFFQKRCLGFYSLVVNSDLTLFDQPDHGILNSGLRAVSTDLDLPREVALGAKAELGCFLLNESSDGRDLLAVIPFECPEWYEPLNRRLSLNELSWLDMRHTPNDLEDFDPWSRAVLQGARHQLCPA